nr:LicD family protein [Eubacterium sp.]
MKELSLEEVKKTELEILIRFDEICKNNNIEYSLAYGTMLGAVRHNGFIPWDDDIDVFVKRSDYEKLLGLRYDDGRFEIKSHRYSNNYYYPFAKMIDKNTDLDVSWRLDKDMGVFIDIFPLDYHDNNSNTD